jgi:hypothetical protein
MVFRKPSKFEMKDGTEFRVETCVSSKHCGLFDVKCLQIGGCTAFATGKFTKSIKRVIKNVIVVRAKPRVRIKDDIIARLFTTYNKK